MLKSTGIIPTRSVVEIIVHSGIIESNMRALNDRLLIIFIGSPVLVTSCIKNRDNFRLTGPPTLAFSTSRVSPFRWFWIKSGR